MSKNNEAEELPENQWRDIYYTVLVDLEEIGFEKTQHFPLEELMSRLPRITLFRDMVVIVAAIASCLLGSFLLMRYDVIPCVLPSERSIDVWASNILIGLSTGLVSGLLLMWFSNRREKTISAYVALIKVMRKRLRSIGLAHEKMQRSYFCYFVQGKKDIAFQWLGLHLNFILTVVKHLKFLNRYIGKKANVDVEDSLERIDSKIRDLRDRWDIESEVEASEARECFREFEKLENGLIHFYGEWIDRIEMNLYDLQYGKRAVKFEETRK